MASDGLYVCLCEIKSLKGPTRPSCSHTRQEGQWWGCRQAAGYQTTLAFLKPVGRTGSSQYGFVMDFFTFFFLLLLSFFFLSFFLLQEHSLSWGRNETLIFLLTGLCTSGNYQRNRCIIDVVGKQEGDFRLKMSPLSWSSLWGWWPHSFHLGTRPVLLNSYSTSLFFKHSQAELFWSESGARSCIRCQQRVPQDLSLTSYGQCRVGVLVIKSIWRAVEGDDSVGKMPALQTWRLEFEIPTAT